MKIHRKRNIRWNDNPDLIDKKYQEIQELYLQAGLMPGKRILDFQK